MDVNLRNYCEEICSTESKINWICFDINNHRLLNLKSDITNHKACELEPSFMEVLN